MKLLVGLGNPGSQYARNRHNVGFMELDEIVRHYRFSPWRSKFHGEVCEGDIKDGKVIALKPMTYMNDSGRAVVAAAQFYKIAPADIIVLHDELDLPPAKMRVKQGGGHAGHNGLRSMMAHLDGEFWRVRLGIGHPGDKALVTGWVLGDFAKADADWLDTQAAALAENLPLLLDGKAEAFQTAVAQQMQPPKPKVNGADRKQAVTTASLEAAVSTDEVPKNAMAETLRRLMANMPHKPGRKGPKQN